MKILRYASYNRSVLVINTLSTMHNRPFGQKSKRFILLETNQDTCKSLPYNFLEKKLQTFRMIMTVVVYSSVYTFENSIFYWSFSVNCENTEVRQL